MLKIHKKTKIKLIGLVSAILLAFGLASQPQSASALTLPLAATPIVVNTVSDTGDLSGGSGACDTGATVVLPDTSVVAACSLRAAIQTANSNGNPSEQDRIEFDIPGAGLKTITQGTISYYITQPILIDGYTQSDASPNTTPWPQPMDAVLRVEIDANAVTDSFGSLAIGSNNITIKGLIVRNSNVSAVQGLGSSVDDITIQGNYFGTDDSGMLYDSVQAGIGLNAGFNRLTVGGPNPEDRNIIAAINRGLIGIGDNSIIQGNFFGVGADGVTAFQSGSAVSGASETISITGANAMIGGASSELGNSIENNQSFPGLILAGTVNGKVLGNRIVGNNKGIAVLDNSSGLEIGDGTAAGRNIISGNDVLSDFATPAYGSGIEITNASGPIKIQGNYIGVAEDGASILPNGADGVSISDSTDVLIGGTQAGEANIIANNQQNGVTIVGNSENITTIGNAIYENTELGIDLLANPPGTYGVPTENDPLDPDTGPNDLLNFPALYVPTISGGDTDIAYKIDVPAGDYRIEFYENAAADPSGYGEGEALIGTQNITSAGAGEQLFSTSFVGTGFSNIRATATLIDGDNPTGFGATSEFSGPYIYLDNDVAVTKTVVDQNTIITNGTLAYTVTYTNNGEDAFDVSELVFDDGDPLNTALFNDVFPSNLTFTSVTGDADCSEQNSAASFGALFSSHTAYTVLSCAYDGASPRILDTGDSLSFTLNFSVTNRAQNILTNHVLAVPGLTDAHNAAYQTAVTSGNDIIDELGSSIDNLASVTTTKPVADLQITKTLTNPNAVAQNGTINYEVELTNAGPGPVLLSDFSQFLSGPILYADFLPPDLTPADLGAAGPIPGSYLISDSGNPDISCLWGGPNSAPVIMLPVANHTDYSVIVCYYTGPAQYLANGGVITTDMNFTIAGDSDLTFKNYVNQQGAQTTTDPSELPSGGPVDDIIDALSNYPEYNNFAVAHTPIDLGVTANLVNPEDVAPGNTIYYDVTVENRGPGAVNLNELVALDNHLIGGAYDGVSLNLIGTTTPDANCISFGPGSNVYWGPAASSHPDHQLFVCVYTGSGAVVGVGESYTIRLAFAVNPVFASELTFYTGTTAARISEDPDVAGYMSGLYGASEDVLDTFTNDNFARVAFTSTGDEDTSNNGTDSNNSNTSQSSGGTLTSTGENQLPLIILATFLLLGSVSALAVARNKRKASQK